MPSTTDTTGAVPRSAPNVCRARPELEEAHSPWPITSRSIEHNTLVSLLAGRQGLHSEPLGNLGRFPVEMWLPQGCWPRASPLYDVCPSIFSSLCIGRNHSLSCHSLTEATAKLPLGPRGAQSQPCLTLWDLVDCSPPGSSVLGILQARILEWVATSYSRGSSQPRDRTRVSCVFCIGRRVLYH